MSTSKIKKVLSKKIQWEDAHLFDAECHRCNARHFKTYDEYCDHLKDEHYGDKNWLTCEFCGKASAHKSNFVSHLSSHTQNPPYKCRVGDCQTATSTRQNLLTHIKKSHRLEISGGGGQSSAAKPKPKTKSKSKSTSKSTSKPKKNPGKRRRRSSRKMSADSTTTTSTSTGPVGLALPPLPPALLEPLRKPSRKRKRPVMDYSPKMPETMSTATIPLFKPATAAMEEDDLELPSLPHFNLGLEPSSKRVRFNAGQYDSPTSSTISSASAVYHGGKASASISPDPMDILAAEAIKLEIAHDPVLGLQYPTHVLESMGLEELIHDDMFQKVLRKYDTKRGDSVSTSS